jgi:hypothetical protein
VLQGVLAAAGNQRQAVMALVAPEEVDHLVAQLDGVCHVQPETAAVEVQHRLKVVAVQHHVAHAEVRLESNLTW